MDLGHPIYPDALWCIEVDVGGGRIVPVAFSEEQAREIAQRIINYYGSSASQAGARQASHALGGPEAPEKPTARTA